MRHWHCFSCVILKLLAFMPGSDYTIFLSVTIVTVSDYTILTTKILLCRRQEICQTTCCYLSIHRVPSLTACVPSLRRRDYQVTEGAVSANKQWLAACFAVLSSEKSKSGHISGLHGYLDFLQKELR